MVKKFLVTGLKLAPWNSTVANNNPDCILRLSQHPGTEAIWSGHLKSRPVWSSHHFVIRSDSDKDLRLFPPKHQLLVA